MEDYVWILDSLPQGRPDAPPHHREPVAYGIGDTQFTVLELIPKQDVTIGVGERVYVGKDVALRDKIAKVKGRINFEQLTNAAQSELQYVLIEIVKKNEDRFTKFFNDAPPISTRYHSLELLPGLGKKTMQGMIEERKKGPFLNFQDMVARVHALHAPEKLVAHRIGLELSNPGEKYHLFARPPVQEPPGRPPLRR
jgi:putative nucleotide binding protein